MICKHKKTVCPRHNGSYDCTPFCDFCEAEQEYCPICNALEIILADLEENNNHTLGKLLIWAYREDTLDKEKAELAYRAWLLARDFLNYGKTGDNEQELEEYRRWLNFVDWSEAND